MFNFFKKKNTFNKDLFIKICISLSEKYSFLSNQVKEGIIVNVKKQDNQYYKFVLDTDLINKYENQTGRYFAIKKIMLSNMDTAQNTFLTLKVGYGVLLGYSIEDESFINYSLDKINVDVSKINIEFFDNNDIEDQFSEEELANINLNDIYAVELNDKLYYHIKDIEDGDFIAIDSDKRVFKITHDPFEIKLLSKSLLDVLK